MKIMDIALIGMMSAIMITAQVALSFIPNIELVSLLVILYTLVFGWKTLFIIYTFVFAEGLIYGFGLWWFGYLYIWAILFAITMLFRKCKSSLLWAILSGLFGLSFGALYAVPYFITSGFATGFAYWVQGIPFDLLHLLGNFITALILYQPLYHILYKIKKWTE